MSREMPVMPAQPPVPSTEKEATPESEKITQEISQEILQTLPHKLVERGVPLAKANEETAGFDQQIKDLDPTIIIKIYEKNGGLQGTIRALFNKAIPQIVARASVKKTSGDPTLTPVTEEEPEMILETIPQLWNTGNLKPEHLGESTASETKFVQEVENAVRTEIMDYLIDKFDGVKKGRLVTNFLDEQFEGVKEEAHAMIKKWEASTGLDIDTYLSSSLNIISNKIIAEIKKSDQIKELEINIAESNREMRGK